MPQSRDEMGELGDLRDTEVGWAAVGRGHPLRLPPRWAQARLVST